MPKPKKPKTKKQYRETQKALRAHKRAHPECYQCGCGEPGFIAKGDDVACEGCHTKELKDKGRMGENRGYARRERHDRTPREIHFYTVHLPGFAAAA
jgi:hypothetical protein